MSSKAFFIQIASLLILCSCNNKIQHTDKSVPGKEAISEVVQPVMITEHVTHDSDDPAIWINSENPELSLILGTDKKSDGAIYVFDLDGKIIDSLTVRDLKRPNNIDVAYGLKVGNKTIDIAVATERETHKLRIFSLPDMQAIDNGGIEVFEGEKGEEYRDLMGIGLYKNPASGEIHAIVGRKNGPKDGTYLWQYQLTGKEDGTVTLSLLRKFGKYSGEKEIEAIAVDSELGYVYYSDETVGVRKYYADPSKGNEELALFAQDGFKRDHEGISIYKVDETTGYILVSDQQSNAFHIFPREGTEKNPHHHPFLKKVTVAAQESDGNEVTSVPLNSMFSKGLFVAMSTDRTFHFYRWEDIAGEELSSINIDNNTPLSSKIEIE
jgi:3-phytase